jgi:pimeloyl-ACP methyl ester carboxylesterase
MRNARAFGVKGLASYFGYSDGIDEVAVKLNKLGIETTTHIQGFIWPYSNVSNVASQAIAAAKQGKKIILYGHSMGGDSAVKIAVRLRDAGHSVELLACFDPTPFGCPDVPENVKKSLGWWQPFGLGGYAIQASRALQVVIDKGQAWLSTRSVEGGSHKKIDNNPVLQAILLNWADKVTR